MCGWKIYSRKRTFGAKYRNRIFESKDGTTSMKIVNYNERHNFCWNDLLTKSNRTEIQTYKVEERTFGTPCSVSLLTGARSFSLGNTFLKLNSLWTVLLLPFCDQPGLRTTENNFALFFSSSSPSSPMPIAAAASPSFLNSVFHLVSHYRYQRRNDHYGRVF